MRILLFTLLTMIALSAAAQDAAPAEPSIESLRKNTIKLDITTRWLYRQAYVLSYERVINPRRTWGLILGFQQLPEARTLGPNVVVTRDTRASGFKAGAEYRFYLAKENKYPAPRGVYIGPYASFNNFHNERSINIDNGDGTTTPADLTASINVLNLGVQIGYQFVFNDRWTVDLSFMGPAISNYNAKLDLSGPVIDPDNVNNEILKDLIARFPGLGDLLGGGSTSSNGRLDTWAFGFRYQVQVGYRFGKKSH